MKLNKRIWIVAVMAMFSAQLSFAQDEVMDQDVEDQIESYENGPNDGFQIFANYGYGVVLPIHGNDSMAVKYGDHFRLGNSYLWNVHKALALGFNGALYYENFNIKQDSAMNLLSPGFENDKQNLRNFTFEIAPVIRIKYGKNGNSQGKYVDLGGYGAVAFGFSQYTRNEVDANVFGGEEVETYTRKLKYMSRVNYGLQAQFGFGKFMVYGKYRLSDMFKQHESQNGNVQLPDLSRFSVGIGFSIWQDSND